MTQDNKKNQPARFNKLFSFFKKKKATAVKGETSEQPKATERKDEPVKEKAETAPDKSSKPAVLSEGKEPADSGASSESPASASSAKAPSDDSPKPASSAKAPSDAKPASSADQKTAQESAQPDKEPSAPPTKLEDRKEGQEGLDQGGWVKIKETAKSSPPQKSVRPEPAKEEKFMDPPTGSAQLEGLFAFKMSMTTFYDEQGQAVPVTALKYKPCRVTQVKTKEKDSYSAVQVAFVPQKNKRCVRPLVRHLKAGGFHEGARFTRELRQTLPSDIKPGQEVSIESLKKGDLIKISALSKGRGFAGVMKRWGFAGGKASHGSKIHRGAGSIGQCAEPGRVMPGRKMPGQYGFKKVSRLKVPVVDVLPEENMIFVKGPVPGARNTLVAIKKMSSSSRVSVSA